tara:strand:- start:150 stop:359 length:210 start_codon:yes stop_codon:yes gene_type:complete
MEKTLEIIKKWGVTGCLVVALFWMNGRLNGLETKLYDCYEKRVLKAYVDSFVDSELIAVKPKELKIKKA